MFGPSLAASATSSFCGPSPQLTPVNSMVTLGFSAIYFLAISSFQALGASVVPGGAQPRGKSHHLIVTLLCATPPPPCDWPAGAATQAASAVAVVPMAANCKKLLRLRCCCCITSSLLFE